MNRELNKNMRPVIQQILWTTMIVSGMATALIFTYVALIVIGVPLPRF